MNEIPIYHEVWLTCYYSCELLLIRGGGTIKRLMFYWEQEKEGIQKSCHFTCKLIWNWMKAGSNTNGHVLTNPSVPKS